MSIEEKLARLADAVEENTAAVKAQNEILQSGIAKKTTGSKTTETKAKPKPKNKTEDKPKSKGKMTAAEFRGEFAPYLTTKDKDELEERKGHLRAIADYFGVAKVTDLKSDDYPEALGYLETYKNGETPEFDGGEEEEEEESVL